MKEIVFATNNRHKLDEVRQILNGKFKVLSLSDIACFDDIPETADTFEGNAFLKADYIKTHYGYDCFSDDSGLEIEALDNAPGVFSARFAGEPSDSKKNVEKVLHLMSGKTDRKARFVTCIVLIEGDRVHRFEGSISGTIIDECRGENGFGYDPIFLPDGYDRTFAELDAAEKNKISHRARAVCKLVNYLNENK